LLRTVPPTAFYPRPKVDSTVVRLSPLTEAERLIARHELADFVTLLHAGFKQPRKQLLNSLTDGLAVEKDAARALLGAAEIEPSRRPQELSVADWARLFRVTRAS